MKKIVLLFAIIAIGTSSFAQDVKYGIKGGLNLANFSGDDMRGDSKADIYFGGFMRMTLTEWLDFQPELVYSRQGSSNDSEGIDAKFKTNFLNIPLLMRAKMIGSDKLYAIAGPQIGIHLSSEYEEDGDTADLDKAMSVLDFSVALGLQYDLNKQFSIEARYNFGLTKIFDNDYYEIDAKNSVFQIGIAASF
ncbi:outer membrane beta-barrel protein [Labilibaculum sp. A4]|uniref:porin family protein n=1 Tax=Labilibaculum euxinus TaxID=2686357 RepID=UPI000F6183F2|nr:porin family protein [Labilibaculum euxinus]MDQ1770381.1 porin family protein [Labilibaculum euxinus]MWN75399.1 outer membrane beta-barrel protein [Labilibaculum euxinus]